MSWQLSSLRPIDRLRLTISSPLVVSFYRSPLCTFVPTRSFRAQSSGKASGQYEHCDKEHRLGQSLPQKLFTQTPKDVIKDPWINARCIDLLTPSAAGGKESSCEGVSRFLGLTVAVHATIRSIRKHKHGAFAHINDGSCFEPIQVVLSSELAGSLNNGTSMRVIGEWKSSPARGQAYELLAKKVDVFGTTDIENYPIQKKYQTTEFLRTLPHLRVRVPLYAVLARFRSECLSFVSNQLSSTDYGGGHFVQVQPPIITSSDCEGAGEVFTLLPNVEASAFEQDQKRASALATTSFFRTPKYLTVSSQLHLEAYAAALRNVWALSPTFRAEKSDTPRHLAEFYMLEIEMGYTTSLHVLTSLVEYLIRSLAKDERVQGQRQELLLALQASQGRDGEHKAEEVEKRWMALEGEPWRRARYAYCMERLHEAAQCDPHLFAQQPVYGSSLQVEHERWIVEHVGLNRPIFVTHYPRAVKPFYMAPSALAEDASDHPATEGKTEVGETVACFDLLMPFGTSEIAGGSLREHRLEQLIANMRQNNMLSTKDKHEAVGGSTADSVPKDDNNNKQTDTIQPYPYLHPYESLGPLKWYADLRRHGTCPHGGFGIGWDRLLAYLTGQDNLRDVVPFPRSYGRADC